MKEKKMKKGSPKKAYSRIQAFCDAVKSKGKGQVKDLITIANKNYVAKGGKNNIKEATTVCNFGLRVLQGMGVVSIEGEDFKIN